MTRPLRFAFGPVTLLGARPANSIEGIRHAAYATWPCPGCEQRRPLDDAWMLQVRNGRHDGQPWNVLICALCVRDNGVNLADNGVRPDRSLVHEA